MTQEVCDFRPISRHILETIQDAVIVTMAPNKKFCDPSNYFIIVDREQSFKSHSTQPRYRSRTNISRKTQNISCIIKSENASKERYVTIILITMDGAQQNYAHFALICSTLVVMLLFIEYSLVMFEECGAFFKGRCGKKIRATLLGAKPGVNVYTRLGCQLSHHYHRIKAFCSPEAMMLVQQQQQLYHQRQTDD